MKIARPISPQPIPEDAKKVFSGILFEVYQWEQKQFDGTMKTFEKAKRRDTVGVLAITKDKKILLLDQEQPGTLPFLGTSGGIVDTGEVPIAAIKRELLEETGYASDVWELFEAVQPASKVDWAIYTFIARDVKKVKEPRLDSGEKIVVKEVAWNEFLDIILREDYRDTQLSLSMLKRLRQPGGEENLREQILGE